MRRRDFLYSLTAASVVTAAPGFSALAQTVAPVAEQDTVSVSRDLAPLLQRVRERVTEYYTDLQGLAWTEYARLEVLKHDGTPKEKPRDLVFDSIIRLQLPTPPDTGFPSIREQNELRIADGKPVKKGDKPKDTDPKNAGMGSLGFLMAADSRLGNFTYAAAGAGEMDGRRVLLVDVMFAQRTSPHVDVHKKFVGFGVRYNLAILGIQFNKGRLWIDAETYDVLRLDWRSDPFEFEFKGDNYRHEITMTMRFRAMRFENPERTLLVPQTYEFVRTLEGGKFPIVRTTTSFADFKRFSGDIKITPLEGLPK